MTDQTLRSNLLLAYKQRKERGGVYIIRNTVNGRYLLGACMTPARLGNRLEFAQKTNSCAFPKIEADWLKYGGAAFTFEILEELEPKDDQTPEMFKEDLSVLLDLWSEKFAPDQAY